MASLVIIDGKVVEPREVAKAHIHVRNGRIASISYGIQKEIPLPKNNANPENR